MLCEVSVDLFDVFHLNPSSEARRRRRLEDAEENRYNFARIYPRSMKFLLRVVVGVRQLCIDFRDVSSNGSPTARR